MKKIKYLLIFLIIFGFLGMSQIVFDFYKSSLVIAGAVPNVAGWAWSGNIGWISFRGINYGVHICTGDADTLCGHLPIPRRGRLVGYAWSSNIGWIHFDPAGPFPTGVGTTATSSRVDLATGNVSGWARAERAITPEGQTLGGWDGWISMRGRETGTNTEYGVWLETVPAPAPNEFRGWAWGDDVVGWISFNDKESLPAGPIDHQVTTTFRLNQPPTAINLSKDPHNPIEYCGRTGYPPVRVRWEFSDPDIGPPKDFQSAFRVQIATNTAFSPFVVDTGKTAGGSPNLLVVPPPLERRLAFNTLYYWRVKVWDNHGLASEWVTGPSFSTVAHPFPDQDPPGATPPNPRNFIWSPDPPAVGEVVQFTDRSVCFAAGSATTTCSSWRWDFDFAIPHDGIWDRTNVQHATHVFTGHVKHTVKLQVEDHSGFVCSITRELTPTLPLPIWREVPPFMWLPLEIPFMAIIIETFKEIFPFRKGDIISNFLVMGSGSVGLNPH
ncbi:MAG: hypothetical protein KYQ20_01150 [Candidatus Nealsonbacteria bacterium]|nr:hypothetical protein [Candidatus Nealsonbacteria bacterium]